MFGRWKVLHVDDSSTRVVIGGVGGRIRVHRCGGSRAHGFRRALQRRCSECSATGERGGDRAVIEDPRPDDARAAAAGRQRACAPAQAGPLVTTAQSGCAALRTGATAGCGTGAGAGTAACCCTGAERRAPGLSSRDKGPSLGRGARSLAPRGRSPRVIGPRVFDDGAVTTAFAGGGAFAASPLQGTAEAMGARPTAPMNPNAAADATDNDTSR